MVYIPSNSPPQGAQGPSPVGSYSDQDTETQFNQLTDAVWEALDACKNSPNDLNAQTFMQTVNALDAFLTANPPQSGTPAATVLADLTSTTSGPSIVSECAKYSSDPTDGATWVEGNISSTSMTNLWSYIDSNNIQNITNDQGNTTIQTDIYNLEGDLQLYNWYEQDQYQNPATLNTLLTNIATDIAQLDKDASSASPALSDGFLTSLMTYLNTPITAGGGTSDTLLSLSQAVLAHTPPQESDLQNLNAALGKLGEQNSNSGGSFRFMLETTIGYEYLGQMD